MQRLSGILAGTILSHEEQDGTAEFIVDHIVDRCKILIESGHVHDAVATVQALAEYHFFMPEELELERVEHRRAEFAKFWNSGYPRIGDEGARGEFFRIKCVSDSDRNLALVGGHTSAGPAVRLCKLGRLDGL